MSTTVSPLTPQGDVIALGIPDSQDYPRLVYCAPYFQQVPLAELIEPSVQESIEALLPSLVPPYVQSAADAAVQQLAVLLTGSTMSGPLMLSPLMPTADSMAATKAYVDTMVATSGVPEVPLVPTGQTWARQTGQWVPLDPSGGNFLPLSGGTMQGQINMSGYAINNLAALPNMPNGAAPANWVLQQIASVSLYQGTWNMDTYTPDLTNPNTHVNGYTWIAITTSTSGVVIGPAIPGLQGQTVFNGDTIIWSNIQGQFNRIHSGGLSLAEAQALFLPFTGGTMTGPLLAFENPTATMEVATMGWVESLLPPGGVIPEAPTDGQLYGRSGLTKTWLPVLPLAGGVMTGAILLSGNATNGLNPVPLQQMQSTLSATYLALAGGTMTGPLVLSGNASANLNPFPLQQLNSMLAAYAPLTQLANYLPLAGGTMAGDILASSSTGFRLATNLTTASRPANMLEGSITTSYLSLGLGPFWNAYVSGASSFNYLNAGFASAMSLNGSNGTWALTNYASGAAGAALGATVSQMTLSPTAFTVATVSPANTAGLSSAGFQVSTASQNGYAIVSANGAIIAGSSEVLVMALDGSTSVMYAQVPGSTWTWPATFSDRRLKQNIAPVSIDALGVINQINVYQADIVLPLPGNVPQHWDCTLIADEIETLIPSAFIAAVPDGFESIRDLPIIATLIKALQQLTAEVAAMKAAPA